MRLGIVINAVCAARLQVECRISPLRKHFRNAGARYLPTDWDEATVFARFYGKTTAQEGVYALFIRCGLMHAGYSSLRNATSSGNLLNRMIYPTPGKPS